MNLFLRILEQMLIWIQMVNSFVGQGTNMKGLLEERAILESRKAPPPLAWETFTDNPENGGKITWF